VGISQLEEGDVENAINTFRKVLELNPNHAGAHSTLGYIYLSNNNIDLARASFKRALEIAPEMPTALNGMGLVLARAGETRQQALEDFRTARRLDPDYLEAGYNLGVTLADMGDFAPARTAFNEVLAKDPEFRDIHYQIGRVALNTRDFTTAEREFIEQYRRDPDMKENRLELGRLYFETERYDRAEEILLPLYGQHQDYIPAALLLADLYLEIGDLERANQLFLVSYRDFSDPETAARLWRDVVDIASEKEREEYRNTPPEKMTDFFRRFWTKRDTDPTTPQNEVLVEHYARLRFAREHFFSPTTPGGYDDRGIIWLRHGPPDDEVNMPGGDGETRPNLTWAYNGRERLIIHFVDRGSGFYQQAQSLMEAAVTTPVGIQPVQDVNNPTVVPDVSALWVDRLPIQAYRERAVLDPAYDRIANMMEDLIRSADRGPDEARTYQDRLELLLTDERMEVLREANLLLTTESYENVAPAEVLPFQMYTAAFKDIQGKTRLEVYYGIPLTDLVLERYGEGYRANVELGIAMFDANWEEISRSNEQREFLSTGMIQTALGSSMIDMNRLVVPPGIYNFAISVTDLNSHKVGVYKDSLYVENFGGRTMAISDIEIAGEVRDPRGGSRFNRGDVQVIPMASRTFTENQKIYIYYEIYNLAKDEFGTTQFTTRYTIQPAEAGRRRGIIASAFRAIAGLVGSGRSESVSVEGETEYGILTSESKYLELALPKRPPGIYRITLRIKDEIGKNEAVRVQEFMVTPPPEGK
jgi:GWxTD domain-containing protein